MHRLKEILSEADRVEVAIEPAGNAWRPLAGALMAYGFDIYLVDPKKSSRLRKALSGLIVDSAFASQAGVEGSELQVALPVRVNRNQRLEPPRHHTPGAFGQVESTVTLGRLAPGVSQGGSGQDRYGHCQVDPARLP